MEKVALLCILMAIIAILAERAPVLLPNQTQPSPQ
jgi:hypothetical protein